MSNNFLNYNLEDGFIQNWLVAGPLAHPLEPAALAEGGAQPLLLAAWGEAWAQDRGGATEAPVDLGPVSAGLDARWRYHRCRDDHYVDLTGQHGRWTRLAAWAYAQVVVPADQTVTLRLTVGAVGGVWVNGQPAVQHSGPGSAVLPVALRAGANEILVRFESAGVGAVPLVMALHLDGAGQAAVQLPTPIEPAYLQRRLELEALAYTGVLDRYVYGYLDGDRYNQNEPIELRFPARVPLASELTFRLQSLQGDIFQERSPMVTSGTKVPLARTFPLRGGPHHLATVPIANEYYVRHLRFDRKELFYVARTAYTVNAGATLKARRAEALTDASQRRSGSFYTELARLALGQGDKLDPKVLERTAAALEARERGAEDDLLGVLVALRRFAKKKPRPDRAVRARFEAAAAGFRYAPEDGPPAARWDGLDFTAQSAQIVFHACEIVAGQLLPERTFALTGQPGAWHRARGEAAALAWLRQRGSYGFAEWHSPAATERVAAALAVLIDLADNEAVAELAAVLLDKVLFGLAVNSWAGAYGASRGSTDTGSVLSARLEPTSGLQRLLWARGNFNEHLMGVTCLALCRQYEPAAILVQAATTPDDAFWGRERHALPHPPSANGHSQPASPWAWSVETAVYKTRNGMLASAQDYAPGRPGRAEHIWQATLGPDAVVFVNHPANTSVDDAQRPNFWAGNGVLPKVAQWGDVLIALHRLPAGDWLGYTHAYFPAAAFDEYAVEGQWAFARKGRGYLALRAENGLSFITTGSSAYRELRSPGHENIWLCHLGQALLDGSFDEFRAKILALDIRGDGFAARAATLRGDQLALLWEGPLLVNGAAQPLAPERHIENPYCVADLPAGVMEIVREGQGMRLRFE